MADGRAWSGKSTDGNARNQGSTCKVEEVSNRTVRLQCVIVIVVDAGMSLHGVRITAVRRGLICSKVSSAMIGFLCPLAL